MIQSFAGEFCGDCSNSAPEERCQNLAVWWSGNSPSEFSTGQIAGNPDGVFSWDVSGRVDMKALCIEKDLKPENHPVILDKNYDRVDPDDASARARRNRFREKLYVVEGEH